MSANFGNFTRYPNTMLEDIMHNADSAVERCLAWIIRFSIGYHKKFVLVDDVDETGGPVKRPGQQKDCVSATNLNKTAVCRAFARLEELGWKREETNEKGERFIYPVQAPDPKRFIPAALDPEEPAVVDDKEWAKTFRPVLYQEYQDISTKRKELLCKELALARLIRTEREQAVAVSPSATAPPVAPSATKSDPRLKLDPASILIGFKERKEIASLDRDRAQNSEPLTEQLARPEPQTTLGPTPAEIAHFGNVINSLRARGKLGSLAVPTLKTMANLLAAGRAVGAAPRDVVLWLDDKSNVSTWETWGAAIHALREDFPKWRKRQPMIDDRAEPSPSKIEFLERQTREFEYNEYRSRAADDYITHKLPAEEYDRLTAQAKGEVRKAYPRMTPAQIDASAETWLRNHLLAANRVPLLSFEAWREKQAAHA